MVKKMVLYFSLSIPQLEKHVDTFASWVKHNDDQFEDLHTRISKAPLTHGIASKTQEELDVEEAEQVLEQKRRKLEARKSQGSA